MNNNLQVILKEQEVDKPDLDKLVKAFGGPFEEAGKILSIYKEVVVTDESDTTGMAKARKYRLDLKKARTTVENNRKELKASIVKQGRAIDSVARYVKSEIEPAEQYLETQEKYAEIKAAERAAKLKSERIEELSNYTDSLGIYSLDEMSDEDYQKLLLDLKKAYEDKVAKEKAEAAEAERQEKERIAEEKRIREENERLRKEAEKREAEVKKAREAEEARLAKIEAERAIERKANEEKLEAERKKREAIEQQKREADEKAAREKAEAEEAERQALLAPDKEKLLRFAEALEVIRSDKLPAVKSKKAFALVQRIDSSLANLVAEITQDVKGL